MKWSNGRHNYYGKYNSRSQRQLSKICPGMNLRAVSMNSVFKELENEKRRTPEETPRALHKGRVV